MWNQKQIPMSQNWWEVHKDFILLYEEAMRMTFKFGTDILLTLLACSSCDAAGSLYGHSNICTFWYLTVSSPGMESTKPHFDWHGI